MKRIMVMLIISLPLMAGNSQSKNPKSYIAKQHTPVLHVFALLKSTTNGKTLSSHHFKCALSENNNFHIIDKHFVALNDTYTLSTTIRAINSLVRKLTIEYCVNETRKTTRSSELTLKEMDFDSFLIIPHNINFEVSVQSYATSEYLSLS